MRAMLCWAILLITATGAAQDPGSDIARPLSGGESNSKATRATRPPSAPAARPADDQVLPLRFRRVYVPEPELLDRVKQGQRYIPMAAEDFDARLGRLHNEFQTPDKPAAKIVHARYTARLDDASRLIGHGAWHIKLTGEPPVLLPLTGLRFALHQPRWTAPEGQSATAVTAKLGATEHGGLALYADRSGTVEFNWSLANSQVADEPWTYELSFPRSPASRIELTLPADMTPSMEGAIISEPQADGEAERLWTIDLVGESAGRLRLLKNDGAKASQPLVLFKPRLTYELSSRGLQLSAECRLDVHGGSIQRLEFDLDPTLTLLSAKAGDTPISWSVARGKVDGDSQRIIVDFPEPLQGLNHLLRLVAVGPLETKAGWQLPNVSARDAVWQDGATVLVVAAPLSLRRLDLTNCRQTKRETLPAPAAGEAIEIQALAPSAAVQVHVSPAAERLELVSATTIELLGNEAVAAYVAEITAQQGERFQLAAEISPDWIIDSVQSLPAGMIADWDLERSRGTDSRLIIHLSRTLNRDRPMRLRIAATRRRAPLGDTLEMNDLRLLAFENIALVRRLARLKTAAPYRLDVRHGHDLARLNPSRLDAADRSLLGDVREGLLFVMDDSASDLQIRLLPERPRIAASLQTRAVVGNRELIESYRLRISPEANELDRILVHCSQTRTGELNWALEDGAVEQVSARRLSLTEQLAQGLGDVGETWEISLKPARKVPFVLTGQRATQLQAEMPVSLPSVRDAASQQCSVVVELNADFIPELQERRLKPLVVEPPPSGAYQNVLAAFEYDPTEHVLLAKEPALILKTDRAAEHRRSAWVWHCILDAWFSSSRQVYQRARFSIENKGRSHVSMTVPGGAFPSVKRDGAPANDVTWDEQTRNLKVPLPTGRRFCLVEVTWTGGEASLGGISSRSLEWPTADIPILGRHAAIWVPTNYILADDGPARHAGPISQKSWRERLFGVLGRPNSNDTFEPWQMGDWSRISGETGGADVGLQWANRFIEQTAHEVLPDDNANETRQTSASWGDQLHRAWYRAAGVEPSPPVPLLVHWEALERAGVRPAAPIDRSTAAKHREPPRVRDVFEQYGLVLLVSQRAVLLTTRQWATTWCDREIASSRDMVIENQSGDFQALPFISTDDAARQFVPLETWITLRDDIRSLWPPIDRVHAENMPHEGWVAYPLDWPENDRPIRLLIVSRHTLIALSIGLLLLSAGVAWRLAARRLTDRIVALGVLIIAALLLPAALAPLGAAAVLGFLAGQCCRWLFPIAVTVRHIELAPQSVAAVASSLMLVAFPWASFLTAQESSQTNDQRASRPVYDVLIPIDVDEKIVGDKVYVPEALYAALMTDKDATPEQRYLITSATYEGPASAVSNDDRPTLPQNWKATLMVEPLLTPARVFLPFGSDGGQIIPDTGRLNGEPLRFGWDEARQSITFDVAAMGIAKVQFEFRPKRRDDSHSRGVTFDIPSVPESRLLLSGASARNLLRVTALGGTTVASDSEQLVAELGPLGQATARGSGGPSEVPPPSQFDSEELAWLKVRPGSAVLNARFTIQVRRGAVNEATLMVDERLLPLPPAADSPIESIRRMSAGELHLRFAEPLTESSVFDLAFIVQGVSGTGKFVWPKVELAGSQGSRRYIACTVDPSLELLSLPPAAIKPVNAAQFATLWGETDARPAAFELPAATPRWELEIRPHQAKLTSRYQSIVQAHVDHAELRWNASLDVSGGSRFQVRLEVPPQVAIDRVDVRDAVGVRSARWALGDRESLTVFLDTAATGKLDLVVRARVTAAANGRIVVPLLHIEGSAQEHAEVAIARRSNVLVSIDNHPDLRELEADQAEALLTGAAQSSPAKPSPGHRGYLVAAFEAQEARGTIVLAVERNRPRVAAIQAISLSRPNDSWQAALDLKLDIAEGVLDTVRIEMPSSWSEPLRIDPVMPSEIVEVAGESRRQLVLYPPQPLAGEARVRIEGRLSPTAGGRVRAPDARLVGATALEEYFVLPLQQELQTLAWETSGLKPEALPEGLVDATTAPDTAQTFLRAADTFRAELRSVEKIAEDVQVRLADIAVSWSSDGACYGVATFDVEPAGRASCRLALPAGYRLIHASVDDRPLRVTPAGDRRWQVPLGGRLPQRISVVFTGHWSMESATPAVIEGPRLIGLPVERTLWTVSGPRWPGAATAANADRATPSGLQTRRYETLVGLIDSAANTLLEVATDETPRWYAAWARRMIASRETLARLRMLVPNADWDSLVPGSASGLPPTTDLIIQDQERLAERLGMRDVLSELSAGPALDESPAAIFNTSLGRSHGALGAMFLGEAPMVQVTYSNPYASDLPSRIVHVLVAAVLLLATVFLVHYTSAFQWLPHRPRVAGIALGLFWWLFLFPSALGWLIVAASVVVPYLPSLFRRRRPRFGWLRRA